MAEALAGSWPSQFAADYSSCRVRSAFVAAALEEVSVAAEAGTDHSTEELELPADAESHRPSGELAVAVVAAVAAADAEVCSEPATAAHVPRLHWPLAEHSTAYEAKE